MESFGPGFFLFQFSDVERMVCYPSCRLGHIFFSRFFLPTSGVGRVGSLEQRANSLTPHFEFASWGFPFLLGAIRIFIFIFLIWGWGRVRSFSQRSLNCQKLYNSEN